MDVDKNIKAYIAEMLFKFPILTKTIKALETEIQIERKDFAMRQKANDHFDLINSTLCKE